jgi:hypothetical protein
MMKKVWGCHPQILAMSKESRESIKGIGLEFQTLIMSRSGELGEGQGVVWVSVGGDPLALQG